MPNSSSSAYGGGARGFVQERMLRQRRYLPTISVGTEAADVIAVSISLTTFQEALNDYVVADEAITCLIELFAGDDMLIATASTEADFSPTTGTLVSVDDLSRMLVTSTTAGAIVLDVTDQAGASGATFIMKVTPLNVPGFPAYASMTFD